MTATTNFWSDFVRWVSERAKDQCGNDVAVGLCAAAGLVSTRGEARVALYAVMSYPAYLIDCSIADFARETGRTPPEDTRSVDVPPGGGKTALLKLAAEFEKKAAEAKARVHLRGSADPFEFPRMDMWSAHECESFNAAAIMARAAAEEL